MQNINYKDDAVVKLVNAFNALLENKQKIEILINSVHGGFCVSKECYEFLGIEWDNHGFIFNNDRSNPYLIHAFKELGPDTVSGNTALLSLVEIDSDEIFKLFIDSHDGYEELVYSGDVSFEYDGLYQYISKAIYKGIPGNYSTPKAKVKDKLHLQYFS